MFFLIQYDRKKGQIANMRQFDETAKHEAENARLEVELELRRTCIDHEVVLLEADNEAALKTTHKRYFYDIKKLLTLTSSSSQVG